MLRGCSRNGGRGNGARETGPWKTSQCASRRSRARPSPGRCRRICPGPRTRLPSGSGKQKGGSGKQKSCGGRRKSGNLRRGRRGTRNRPSKSWLGRERSSLHAAAREPVAKREDWQDWRDRAEAAMAEAGTVAEDAALGEDVRKALAASAEALAQGLAVDREASALYRDWQEHFVPTRAGDIHRFHAPGSAALADRTAALEERVTHPLEMPGLLRMGLGDHRERAEEWSRIGECRAELARLARRLEPGLGGVAAGRARCGASGDGDPERRDNVPRPRAERDRHGRGDGGQRRRARP